MLVLDGDLALPGPASLDLRRGAAELLGVGEALGRVGTRDRWRFSPANGARPAAVPLRGWVFLRWGGELAARRLAPHEVIERLFEHVALRLRPVRPEALLDLAAVPAWEVVRPHGLERLDEAVSYVVATATGAARATR
jgi:hypothetical protein